MNAGESTIDESRATAYHEAGHAAVLHYFELPFDTVSIEPDIESDGRCVHPSIYALDLGEHTRRERKMIARQLILCAYAGLHAHRLIDPDVDEACAETDEDNAFDFSREHGVFPSRLDYVGSARHCMYLDKLKAEAGKLVQRLKPQIAALGEALLAEKELGYEEACRVLDAA